MKKLCKRLLCAVLIAVIALPHIAFDTSAADDSGALFGREAIMQMSNGEAMTAVYDILYKGINSFEEEISVNNSGLSVSISELSVVYKMLLCDHPELFWTNNGYSYSSYTDGTLVSVYPSYCMTKDDAASSAPMLRAKADSLCEGLDGLSDYEISLALHDRLADAVDYAASANDQTAYGALVEGKAVCAGYSAAYQYLLKKMGISAFTVTGSAYDSISGIMIAHAWNLVQLDGSYYLTDVTWDDHSDTGHIYHEYFNTTSKKLYNTHVADNVFLSILPDCTARELNYFVKTNTVISEFDTEKIAVLLKKNNYKAVMYADGGAYELAQTISERITDIAKALNISGRFSYGFSMLGNELILQISSESLPRNYITVNVTLPEGVTAFTAELYSDKGLTDTVTSTDNTVFFNDLESGSYTLKIQADGCCSVTLNVNVDADGGSADAVLHFFGDIDGDGQINTKDSYMQKLIIMGIKAEYSALADLNGDGIVNTKDSYILKKIITEG